MKKPSAPTATPALPGLLSLCALLILSSLSSGCTGDSAAGNEPVDLSGSTFIAVVTTDYSSTAISVLDSATGRLVNQSVYSSSTEAPGISLPLSYDVTLPTSRPPDDMAFIIDRAESNVTVFNATDFSVVRQIPIGQSSDGTWSANPYDAILSGSNRLFVTRFDAHTAPTADGTDMDEGDDIVVIDLDSGNVDNQITFDSTLLGSGYRAAPSRMADAGDYLVVALSHYKGTAFSEAGDGLVAVIDKIDETLVDADPETGGTQLIEIPEFNNCGGVSYSPIERAAYVVCSGLFADGYATQTDHSGVVRIDLSPLPHNPPTYEVMLSANDTIDQPLSAVECVDSNTVFVLTYGSFPPSGTPDQLFAFDPSNPAADAELVYSATGPFQLGSMSYDPGQSTLYVADAPYGGPNLVHRFRVAVADVNELSGTDPSPDIGLGPTVLSQFVVK